MARFRLSAHSTRRFKSPLGKRLALLKEVVPGVNRVLVMVNTGSDSNQHELRAIEAAASSSGVYVSSAAVSDASEIERAMEVVARESKAGLIITPGSPILDLRKLIFALESVRGLHQ